MMKGHSSIIVNNINNICLKCLKYTLFIYLSESMSNLSTHYSQLNGTTSLYLNDNYIVKVIFLSFISLILMHY